MFTGPVKLFFFKLLEPCSIVAIKLRGNVPKPHTIPSGSMCYKCLDDSAPDYLRSWVDLYSQPRSLRSASDPLMLRVPRMKLVSAGQQAFSYAGPSTCNLLPLQIRQSPNLETFKNRLKTHLFL
jgi:hypothetical protein